ncbi:MAG TPA: helix-turn-helix domain-containing protein, partial [Kofleriaceae bacterium]|nr:helix-turn-helix domain-containing protein [Kofleriaceae bacterium]
TAACHARDAFALAETLAELAPASHESHAGHADAGVAARAAERDLAHALAHELRLRFADATPLSEIAEAAHASVFHACRVFRRAFGTTLHAYRRELRLRHALAQLIDSDAPLAAIAAGAGFASQSHLTNLFRARFATTPGAVRAARAL